MKTLIIGAGSVGLVFAGKLSAASIPYQLLTRSNYHSLSRGFKLTTMKGGKIGAEATICPPAGGVLTLEEAEKLAAKNPWDNIIVATQTTQLFFLAPTLSSLMKPDGICLCLQNGYDFERPLAEALLPSQTLLSGTTWVKATTLEKGLEDKMPHVRHDFGIDLYLGCYSKDKDEVDYSENSQALALFTMLETAGFNVERVRRVKDAQWTKLVLNVPFFLTCALQEKSVSEVIHTPELYAEMMTLRQELITAAGLAGNEPNLGYISTIDEQLAKMAVTPLSSAEEFAKRMCAELEPNAGALLTALRKQGIETPLLCSKLEELKKKQ